MASKSRIISALINAAKNGKKVTVVIELQARFDEENNIKWTNNLKNEGVDVISGIPGLKVHSKIALVTRRENGKLKEYASVGTGNFHEGTAKFYTDYHLMTSKKEITKEVSKVFDFVKTNYLVQRYDPLIVSPHYSRKKFYQLIEEQIDAANQGEKASILLKMNSLSDLKMVDKLYQAGAAGVKIRLIIRGVCSLIPGVKGLSENIEAISVVDRFLEHSRVFVFGMGEESKVFLGSADWMGRNLDHRLEVTVPVLDAEVKQQLLNQMECIWSDNQKARLHNQDQINAYRKGSGEPIRSQVKMIEILSNTTHEAH
jgi:polyphosphate kinase